MTATMMSHLSARAGELKSRGAVEAAQNPDSKVNAEDAEHVILDESQKAGAIAFTFDANVSPEAKAAQAHTVRLFCAMYKIVVCMLTC